MLKFYQTEGNGYRQNTAPKGNVMRKMESKLPYSEASIDLLLLEMPDILTTSGEKPSWNDKNTDDDGWT